MYAASVKIWSIEEILNQNNSGLRLIVKGKKNMREFTLSLVAFKKDILDKYKNRYFGCGDTVKIDFFINAKEFQDKYYNNLFVENLVVKKRSSRNNYDIFGFGNNDFLNQ
jgi:hypothetical protein